MDEKILLSQNLKPNDEHIEYNSFFFRRDIIDKYIKQFNHYCNFFKKESPLKKYKIYNIDDIIFHLLNKPGIKTRRYNLLNKSDNWKNIKKYIISLIAISLSEICHNNVDQKYVIKNINKYIIPYLNNTSDSLNYNYDIIILAPEKIEEHLLYIHSTDGNLEELGRDDDENDDNYEDFLDFKINDEDDIYEKDPNISLRELSKNIYSELDKFNELKFSNYQEQFKEKFKLISGFAIVNRGKCKMYPNDYMLNLICTNTKGIGSVMIGLYLYTILKHPITTNYLDIFDDDDASSELIEQLNGNATIIHKKIKRKNISNKFKYEKKYGINLYKRKFTTDEPLIPTNGIAVLELANGYKNVSGLCSYEKFGFSYDKKMFSNNEFTECTDEIGNIPMNIYFGNDTTDPCYSGLSIQEKIYKVLNISIGNSSENCNRNYICNANLNNENNRKIVKLYQQLNNLKLYQDYFMQIYNSNSYNIVNSDDLDELDDEDFELLNIINNDLMNITNYQSNYELIIKLIESIETENMIPELEYFYNKYLNMTGGKIKRNTKTNTKTKKNSKIRMKGKTIRNKKKNKNKKY
jgi:hypothetical protein